jgi:transposase
VAVEDYYLTGTQRGYQETLYVCLEDLLVGGALDSLGAYKGKRVRDLVEARDTSLLFLPTYSRDFSFIEEAFSKIRALLKKASAPTREALVESIGKALQCTALASANTAFRTLLPPEFRPPSQ